MPSCRLGKARLGVRGRVTEECGIQSGERQGPLPPGEPAPGRPRCWQGPSAGDRFPPLGESSSPGVSWVRDHFCLGWGHVPAGCLQPPDLSAPMSLLMWFHLPFSPSPKLACESLLTART